MSASSFQVQTLAFPASTSSFLGKQYQEVNSSLSFTYYQASGIVTLSTNSALSGAQIDGLLYVPDLDPSDPCANSSAPYVPTNVTRQANLPGADFNSIAIAPWLSVQCTQSYLASARNDPISAFIFFLPNQNGPPPANDAAWNMNDGGQWKQQDAFPVYAIPSTSALTLLQTSALYSGNLSSVPFGASLSKTLDPNDYVRLAMGINTASSSGLPSLWIFLLIIVAILIIIVGIISLSMHLMQRRRRESLRRRIAAGEVNLEALGVKRLTVPESMLNQLPTYTFEQKNQQQDIAMPISGTQHSRSGDADAALKPPASSVLDTLQPGQQIPQRSHFDQPTCAICLDDFEPGVSTVRQLPCEHIFHPECVDAFLRDNSSLCPLCKASVLPKGHCPTAITNAMVRRERLLRRPRLGADRGNSVTSEELDEHRSMVGRLLGRLRHRPTQYSDVELGSHRTTDQDVNAAGVQGIDHSLDATGEPSLDPGPAPPVRQTHARREWARRRALALLGPRALPDTQHELPRNHPSRWRKGLYRVFPGIG